MIVTCWTLLNTSTWPYPHAITWLVFNAQLLVPMVDATHGLVLHSIKHEISEPKHDALLFLQHITLSDSARIATVVFATRLFNAPAFAMPRGIITIVAAYLLLKWCLEDWNQREWESWNWTKRREGFSDCRLWWLGSGASGLRTRWHPAALGSQGALRRAKHNWWFCDVYRTSSHASP